MARRAAMVELSRTPSCGCCESLIQHLQQLIGSTLFTDEDPYRLWMTLPANERSRITPQGLAACIVLYGRARQELFPRDRPATWPAAQLLAAGSYRRT